MSSALLQNKKFGLKFSVVEKFSSGVELIGSEVKALRNKLGSLEGARVVVRGGEAFLIGATIPPYQVANTSESYDPERARRLLLSKKEITLLADAESKKGLTVVPLELYNAGRHIKLSLAIAKGKGKEDRREDLKKATALREAEREAKR